MKPEDIKVGSIWHRNYDDKIRIKVTDIENSMISVEIVTHIKPYLIGQKGHFGKDSFLYCHIPVYTVEGFEV